MWKNVVTLMVMAMATVLVSIKTFFVARVQQNVMCWLCFKLFFNFLLTSAIKM